MKNDLTIFVDLDGVMANWMDSAIKTANVCVTTDVYNGLKRGKWLDDYVPDLWDYIDPQGPEWWANLELTPWANDLYELVSKFGDVAFLSSPGNAHKHLSTVKNACCGKHDWVLKHFPDVPLVLAHAKYVCASNDKLLIDDTIMKLDAFAEHGGHTFLWPNQFRILDGDLDIKCVLNRLREKCQEIKDAAIPIEALPTIACHEETDVGTFLKTAMEAELQLIAIKEAKIEEATNKLKLD